MRKKERICIKYIEEIDFMWIKIKYVDTNEKTVILPIELSKKLKLCAKIVFASLDTEVNVQYDPMTWYSKKSSFEKPIKIYLSKDLKDKLLIPETQIYQAKIQKQALYIRTCNWILARYS